MRILVDGAGGFIGGQLCRAMAEGGHEAVRAGLRPVTAWDRPEAWRPLLQDVAGVVYEPTAGTGPRAAGQRMGRRRRPAAPAAAERPHLPPRRGRRRRHGWAWLGYPAFAAMLVVFWLMVNKPAF